MIFYHFFIMTKNYNNNLSALNQQQLPTLSNSLRLSATENRLLIESQ